MKKCIIAIGVLLYSLLMLQIGVGIQQQQHDKEPPKIKTITETVEKPIYIVVEEIKEPKSLGVFELTAYCSCENCCGKSNGITATGTKATAGRTIAVDPSIIPYGTEVVINGHTYVAEDCGGAVKGNRIDVFCSDHNAALQFGRQKAEIFASE